MQRFFGTSQPKPKATLKDAISSADDRLSAINVKIMKTQADIKAQLGPTRDVNKLNPGARQRVVQLMKQKKMYEAQRDQLSSQIFNMESAELTTDNLKNTAVTYEAMARANKTMQKEYRKINVDKIEDMQDNMQDLMEQANLVQEALSRSYETPEMYDEDELLAELKDLEVEAAMDAEMGREPVYLEEDEPLPAMPELGLEKEKEKERVSEGVPPTA